MASQVIKFDAAAQEVRRAFERRLGPVASWIVAFTITDVLRRDKSSFCNQKNLWYPTLGKRGVPSTLADIIRHAGMPVTKKDWCEHVGMDCA